jgi:hypothetical protein
MPLKLWQSGLRSPTMEKQSKSVWSVKIAWKLYLQCIAWGAVIEAPLLAWFFSVRFQFHVSVIPALLVLLQIVGFALSYFLMVPFEHSLSESAQNLIGYPLIFLFQSIAFGTVIYGLRGKDKSLYDSK